MTAEIAIFNKTAVALAADSAVTIGPASKIYNSANKLFTLSKYQPVGIMVYGNAQIMGVPWETVIKSYRSKLGDKHFPQLKDYAADFFSFIGKAQNLFPPQEQKKHFKFKLNSVFRGIVDKIGKKVEARIKEVGSIADADVAQITELEIKNTLLEWKALRDFQNMPKNYDEEIISVYADLISEVIVTVFEKLPVSESMKTELVNLCKYTISKDSFLDPYSGIVIAGFGHEEFFPSCITHFVDAVINNKLRFAHVVGSSGAISFESGSRIITFAQGDVVQAFIRGADPNFFSVIRAYMKQIFQELPEIIVQRLQDNSQKEQIVTEIASHRDSILKSFDQQMLDYSQQHYIDPVINAVDALSKDDLAAMAESLVNLTSFKRKVTMGEKETVGGPIDVAVISKGDGFIWIKRKHYFQTEQNQHFMRNYYRKED